MSSNLRSDSDRRNVRASLRLVVNRNRKPNTADAFDFLKVVLMRKAIEEGTLDPKVVEYHRAAGVPL